MAKFFIVADLDELEVYKPPSVQVVKSEEKFKLKVVDNLAYNKLVTGPAFMPKDIRCSVANILGRHTSGVLGKFIWSTIFLSILKFHYFSVLGLNNGNRTTYRLRQSPLINTFEVAGKFGKATDTNFSDSIMTTRATFDHIYPDRVSSVLASMQAAHQKQMYQMSGVDIQSQTAYELALKGPIRPAIRGNPVIYGIKLIEFTKPRFKIEVQGINVKEDYLGSLIAEIGLQMRSVAFCQGVRCKQYGHFTFKDSLLRSHFRLQEIFDNMKLCKEIIHKNSSMFDDENSNPVGMDFIIEENN